jgi:transporter family-2 protein
MGFLIALLSGALMSVQGVFNTAVTKATSMWVANCWVQITAFAVCLIAWFVTGRDSFGKLLSMDHKYVLLGGVIGAFITYTVIKSVETLGPAKSALLIVIAQLTVSYLIELFGLFGMEKVDFEWKKLFGLLVAVAGIIIFKK